MLSFLRSNSKFDPLASSCKKYSESSVISTLYLRFNCGRIRRYDSSKCHDKSNKLITQHDYELRHWLCCMNVCAWKKNRDDHDFRDDNRFINVTWHVLTRFYSTWPFHLDFSFLDISPRAMSPSWCTSYNINKVNNVEKCWHYYQPIVEWYRCYPEGADKKVMRLSCRPWSIESFHTSKNT